MRRPNRVGVEMVDGNEKEKTGIDSQLAESSEEEASGEICLILCHCSGEKEARHLGTFLVKEKLAFCVNILPAVESIYSWEGQFVQERESLLMIKTMLGQEEPLMQVLKQEHSYEVPDIIALKSWRILGEYACWGRSYMKKRKESS